MLNSGQNLNNSSIRSQLISLIDIMSEPMQVKLLKFLEKKFKRLRAGTKKLERRGDLRRQCLIPVDYLVQGQIFNSYILDISAYGVFIETDEPFAPGLDIRMTFSLPEQKEPFNFSGQIVWSGAEGLGVKFNYISKQQMATVKTFAEQAQRIYEIIS
jgi:Tfp pilus assembly protein PilZ